jgi:hypothetical protein
MQRLLLMPRNQAGVAQLVERNLAKVEVASSSLVSRSKTVKGKLTQASLFAKSNQFS